MHLMLVELFCRSPQKIGFQKTYSSAKTCEHIILDSELLILKFQFLCSGHTEAGDNVKFLSTLERHFKNIWTVTCFYFGIRTNNQRRSMPFSSPLRLFPRPCLRPPKAVAIGFQKHCAFSPALVFQQVSKQGRGKRNGSPLIVTTGR